MKAPDKEEFVTALARGLAVIKSFGKDSAEQTLSDVAKHTGLARATARRVLFTLEALGYARSDGTKFSLTPRILELGYAFLSSEPLAEIAYPIMKQVVEELGESCSLSVLDGDDIVYIARVAPKHLMTIPVNVGTRLPAAVTSTGRVMLAALPKAELDRYLARVKFEKFTKFTSTPSKLAAVLRQVAEQGYSLADQELEEGLRALAVPVFSRSGTVIAGLNVSAHAMRATKKEMLQKHLPVLKRAAAEISGLSIPRGK